MSFESDSTGEVINSPELRDKTISLLPEYALKNQTEVTVKYPISRGFITVSFMPHEAPDEQLYLSVIDTQQVVSGFDPNLPASEAKPKIEFHGMKKVCWINPITGAIEYYRETPGKLDEYMETFVEDVPAPREPRPLPEDPTKQLLSLIWGEPPLTEEEVALESLELDLQFFDQAKHDSLLNYFAELDMPS